MQRYAPLPVLRARSISAGLGWLAVALLAAGCADDIRPSGIPDAGGVDPGAPDADPAAPDGGAVAGRVTTTDLGDGSFRTVVDASAQTDWVGLDLATGQEADAAGTAWDLSFQRFHILLDGGVSGDGGVEAAVLPGADFGAIAAAPAAGFQTDAADGEDDGDAADTVFETVEGGWYDYDPATHVLTPKPHLYIVRTRAGAYVKLQLEDYYDDAGTSGYFTFHWAPIDPPAAAEPTELVIPPDSAGAWIYVDLRQGAIVTVGDPATSGTWDLAVNRTLLATNSGSTGGGQGGAADPGAADLAAIGSAAGADYQVDALLPIPGPPGSGEYSGSPVLADWYDYDPVTHIVSPKAKAYLVRTADGGHVKLAVTAYGSGTLTIQFVYAGPGQTDF